MAHAGLHMLAKHMLLVALVTCQGAQLVSGSIQVQAVFQLQGSGLCLPIPDDQLSQLVSGVLDRLTGAAWGGAEQADGWGSLCQKLGEEDRGYASCAILPSPPPPPPPAPPSPPLWIESKSPPPPAIRGIRADPEDNPYLTDPYLAQPGASPASRKLLQEAAPPPPCTGSSVFLYLEATNPEDPHDVAEALRRAVQHGLFLQQLQQSTSLPASSAQLMYITVADIVDPKPPTVGTDIQALLQLEGARYPLASVEVNRTMVLISDFTGVAWAEAEQQPSYRDLLPRLDLRPGMALSPLQMAPVAEEGTALYLEATIPTAALEDATAAISELEHAVFLSEETDVIVANVTLIYLGRME